MKNLKGKNYIHSNYQVIINSKFVKLSKNHSFTVEACFEHTLIHIIKRGYLKEKDMKTIWEYHSLFKKLNIMLNWEKHIEFSDVRNTILDYSN